MRNKEVTFWKIKWISCLMLSRLLSQDYENKQKGLTSVLWSFYGSNWELLWATVQTGRWMCRYNNSHARHDPVENFMTTSSCGEVAVGALDPPLPLQPPWWCWRSPRWQRPLSPEVHHIHKQTHKQAQRWCFLHHLQAPKGALVKMAYLVHDRVHMSPQLLSLIQMHFIISFSLLFPKPFDRIQS